MESVSCVLSEIFHLVFVSDYRNFLNNTSIIWLFHIKKKKKKKKNRVQK